STIALKEKIEGIINEMMVIVSELTGGEITHITKDNTPVNRDYSNSDKLVFLKKSSVNFDYGFALIGYAINFENGFPVSVETDIEYFDCQNEDELRATIADIIDKKAIKIIQLVEEKVDDIPF
ncbi:hypothetical protein QK324_25530, partial [Serratia ureilytica]